MSIDRIVASPTSPMPEPYRTYVAERSAALAAVLDDFLPPDLGVQLCPRAIMPDEIAVGEHDVIYGAVVQKPADGLKSVLYAENSDGGGMAYSAAEAVNLAQDFLAQGERVRVKDPAESDGRGQHTVNDESGVAAIAATYPDIIEHGLVIMPHLEIADDGRFSVGMVDFGPGGAGIRIAREFTTIHPDGGEARGGGELAMVRAGDQEGLMIAAQELGVPERVVRAGLEAIGRYLKIAKRVGCVSVDVVRGKTDSDRELTLVVDITPRVNGFSGEEVLAMREFSRNPNAQVVLAHDHLSYNTNQRTRINPGDLVLVNQPSLLMVAGIRQVLEKRS